MILPKYTIKRRNSILISPYATLISPIIAIIATVITSSILLLVLNYDASAIMYTFFIEPLISLYDFSEVVMKATILIIIALGLTICFRANIWNIGAEGQFIIGAIFGSIAAIQLQNAHGGYVIVLIIISGIFGGILWASIPAFLKNYFNTNEILSSLMLVYIAELTLSYLVHGPLKDPDGFNFPQSIYFSDSAIYPYLIDGTRLSITPIFLIIIVPLVYILLMRSYLGFQLRVTGFSQKSASYSGFNAKKIVWISFLICGGLAGLAGISEVSANISQLIPDISPGYGFTAIIVAFLGRLHPIGIIFAGFLLALTYIGAETAQIVLGLPISIGKIFQGLILFFLLTADFFLYYKISSK